VSLPPEASATSGPSFGFGGRGLECTRLVGDDKGMHNWIVKFLAIIAGIVAGSLLYAVGRSANGFVSGPEWLLGLVVLVLSGVGGAIFFVRGKSAIALAVVTFAIAGLLTAAVLPLLWPYPAFPELDLRPLK